VRSSFGVSILCSLMSAAAWCAPAEPSLPIIDVHIHAERVPPEGVPRPINCGSELQEFAPLDGRAKFGGNDVRSHCDKVLVAPATDADNRAAVLKYFEQYNITGTLMGRSLEEVGVWSAQFGTRGIPGFGMIMPGTPSVQELRAAVTSGKVRFLGEVGVQYHGIEPAAVSMEPYWALAEELDFPVGIHMGLGAPAAPFLDQPEYQAKLSNPLLLEPVLRRHPRLRVYVMHAGWPMTEEMIHLMYTYPQVYVDTAIIDWGIPRKAFYDHLQRLVDAGFGNRIMFGTDQMIWPDAIPVAIDAIRNAPFLSKAQKRDIFYNNAVRFFRLPNPRG
jgi:uncharacterized protein